MENTVRFSAENLNEMAAELLKIGGQHRVWTFSGDMGAGKTTLIASLCKLLGVEDAISSPTYAIVHEYQGTSGHIHHIDAYRINSLQEALDAGLEELIHGNGHCFIEWPEKIQGLLPEHYFSLSLSGEGSERILSYTSI